MGGSLEDLVDELAPFARDLVDAAGAAGLHPRITSTVRTRSEQARLYRRFLAGQAGYPVVPPGFSAHEYGEAFDMVVTPMAALADVDYTWQTWGGGWSGADAVHFELPGATERAKQYAVTHAEPGFWEQLIEGLPITFWPSIIFQMLGVPMSARADLSYSQQLTLRRLVKDLPTR